MRTLIIEDETQAIDALKSELSINCPNISIIGEAKTVKNAIQLINELSPDLIFLDIQLADGNGFEILDAIKDSKFKIIFTTAYNQYAMKAIKYSAFDYLLKPIDTEELVSAINRLKESWSSQTTNLQLETLLSHLKNPEKRSKIALPTNEGITIFEINSIIKCSAESNYTTVYFNNGKKILFSKTLKDFEDLLEGANFERIHHSHIINMNHLLSFNNKDGGYVVMSDKSSVPVSQRKKTTLMEALQKIK